MNIALILSGGTGTRLGETVPKQYIRMAGKPILIYCMETLVANEKIDAIQIVADVLWQKDILSWIAEYDLGRKFKGFSMPGKNRQLSILHGLESIREYASDDDWVLVHDAARPMLSRKMIDSCLAATNGHDGVLPVLPMKDTVYYSDDGQGVSSLLKREKVFAGQAPEIFVLGKYINANERLMPTEILMINGSTEPAIMAGMDIVMIPGDEGNYKITTKADLERFRQSIENR